MTPQRKTIPPPVRDPFSTQEAMLGWVREIAPYGIFTTDKDLVVRDWNDWMAAQSGRPAGSIVGRSLLQLFPDLTDRNLAQYFSRALRGEVSILSTALHRYLLPFPNPVDDFATPHMLQTARIAPLPMGDKIVGTVTIVEDVTQRESHAAILRRQQEYDRLLSDALAMLIRSRDPIRTVADIFPRIASSLKVEAYFSFLLAPARRELQLQSAAGLTPEARRVLTTVPVGTGFCGLVAEKRTPLVESNVQQNTRLDAQAMRRLGLQSYAGFPLIVGDRVLGVLAFGSYARELMAPDEIEFLHKLSQYLAIALERSQREVTLQAAQEQLSRHAGELETKVTERTARLHETIAQLESFSYTVAHDLRAPIRSLTGFSEILLLDFAAALPAEAQDMLRRLRRASRKLDLLTRDLLSFSRVMREEVPLSRLHLDPLVMEFIAEMPALQHGTVEVAGPLGDIVANPTLVEQCLANLFDNALKFARPGVPPRILLRAERRASAGEPPHATQVTAPMIPAITSGRAQPPGPRLRLWIEDNGIGIPKEALDRIWGVFERLPTEVEGTGIGLAIVARAMQQMGGSCGVESSPGTGARFWLEFAVP